VDGRMPIAAGFRLLHRDVDAAARGERAAVARDRQDKGPLESRPRAETFGQVAGSGVSSNEYVPSRHVPPSPTLWRARDSLKR